MFLLNIMLFKVMFKIMDLSIPVGLLLGLTFLQKDRV